MEKNKNTETLTEVLSADVAYKIIIEKIEKAIESNNKEELLHYTNQFVRKIKNLMEDCEADILTLNTVKKTIELAHIIFDNSQAQPTLNQIAENCARMHETIDYEKQALQELEEKLMHSKEKEEYQTLDTVFTVLFLIRIMQIRRRDGFQKELKILQQLVEENGKSSEPTIPAFEDDEIRTIVEEGLKKIKTQNN